MAEDSATKATRSSETELLDPQATARATIHRPAAELASGLDGERFSRFDPKVITREEVLAEGGQGRVFKAWHTGFKDWVALKRLKNPRDPTARARFVAEALISRGLQNARVTPIYDLYWEERLDGRRDPVLSMKLLSGRSWRSALKKSVGDAAVFDAAIERLIAVCQVIEFAHGQGFLHLDLKPENIHLEGMPDGREEVIVMDWGLGAAFDERGARLDAPRVQDITSVCGTLAYMPPEQAAGRGFDLGPWTDVYLLAAILYELVYGQPPHDAPIARDALKSALKGEPPAFPDGPPVELIALLRRALEPRHRQRLQCAVDLRLGLEDYRDRQASRRLARGARGLFEAQQAPDSREVADRRGEVMIRLDEVFARYRQALEFWPGNREARDGEREARAYYAEVALRFSDLELARAQAHLLPETHPRRAGLFETINKAEDQRARAARRSRALNGIIGAALVLIALVSTVAAVLTDQARRQAADREGIASQALKSLIYQVRDKLKDLPGSRFREARAALLQEALAGFDKLARSLEVDGAGSHDVAVVHVERGDILRDLGKLAEATQAYERARAVCQELLARDPSRERARRSLALAEESIGRVLLERGRLDDALEASRRALAENQKLARRKPADPELRRALASNYEQVGTVHQLERRFAEARKAYGEALTIADELFKDKETVESALGLVFSLDDLASLDHDRLAHKEALAGYRRGLEIVRKLREQEPESYRVAFTLADSLGSVGRSLRQLDQHAEAEAIQRERLTVLEELLAGDPPNTRLRRFVADAQQQLARTEVDRGRFAQARSLVASSEAAYDALLENEPENHQVRVNRAEAALNRGHLEKLAGRLDEAMTAYEHALSLGAGDGPELLGHAFLRPRALGLLGDARAAADQQLAAISYYEECLASLPAPGAEKQDALLRLVRASALLGLGKAAWELGRVRRSRSAFEACVRLLQDETSPSLALLEARSAHWIAALALEDQRDDEAKSAAERALKITRGLLASAPENPVYQDEIANRLDLVARVQSRSSVEEGLKTSLEAVQWHRRLIAESPDNGRRRFRLADSLLWRVSILDAADRSSETRSLLEEALGIDLALEEDLRASVAVQRSLSLVYEKRAFLLMKEGRFQKALADFEESARLRLAILERRPKHVKFRRDASTVLRSVGFMAFELKDFDHPRYLRAFEKAEAISRALRDERPEDPELPYELAEAIKARAGVLQHSGKLAAAVAAYEALMDLCAGLRESARRRRLAVITALSLGQVYEALKQETKAGAASAEVAVQYKALVVAKSEAAVELAPFVLNLARSRCAKGRFPEAAEHFGLVIASEAYPQGEGLYLEAARAAAQSGDDRVLPWLRQSLRITRSKRKIVSNRLAEETVSDRRQRYRSILGQLDAFVETAKNSPDFAALRGREDFERLFADR